MRKQVWTYGTHQCSSNNTKVKQHFYKFDDDTLRDIASTIFGGADQLPTLLMFLGVRYLIMTPRNKESVEGELTLLAAPRVMGFDHYCRFIESDIAKCVKIEDDYGTPTQFKFLNTVYDHIDAFVESTGALSMSDQLKSCFTEISEQEYLSQIGKL